jgi:hypothetical protein
MVVSDDTEKTKCPARSRLSRFGYEAVKACLRTETRSDPADGADVALERLDDSTAETKGSLTHRHILGHAVSENTIRAMLVHSKQAKTAACVPLAHSPGVQVQHVDDAVVAGAEEFLLGHGQLDPCTGQAAGNLPHITSVRASHRHERVRFAPTMALGDTRHARRSRLG